MKQSIKPSQVVVIDSPMYPGDNKQMITLGDPRSPQAAILFRGTPEDVQDWFYQRQILMAEVIDLTRGKSRRNPGDHGRKNPGYEAGHRGGHTPHRNAPGDQVAADELVIYAENDYDLWMRRRPEFLKNVARKLKRGKYDPAQAVKLWEYYATEAAKSYSKGYGQPYHQIFDKSTRRLAAQQFAIDGVETIEEYGGAEAYLAQANPGHYGMENPSHYAMENPHGGAHENPVHISELAGKSRKNPPKYDGKMHRAGKKWKGVYYAADSASPGSPFAVVYPYKPRTKTQAGAQSRDAAASYEMQKGQKLPKGTKYVLVTGFSDDARGSGYSAHKTLASAKRKGVSHIKNNKG